MDTGQASAVNRRLRLCNATTMAVSVRELCQCFYGRENKNYSYLFVLQKLHEVASVSVRGFSYLNFAAKITTPEDAKFCHGFNHLVIRTKKQEGPTSSL